jgi:hypothetical protein
MAKGGLGGILIGATVLVACVGGGLPSLVVVAALASGGYLLVRKMQTEDRLQAEKSSMSLDCRKCGTRVVPKIVADNRYKYDCECGHSWTGHR